MIQATLTSTGLRPAGEQTTLDDFNSVALTPSDRCCGVCGETIDDAARHYLHTHPDAVNQRRTESSAGQNPCYSNK